MTSCDGDIVIVEETTTISTEVCHHRIEMDTQNNSVLICSEPSLNEAKDDYTIRAKRHSEHTGHLIRPTVWIKGSNFFAESFVQDICTDDV